MINWNDPGTQFFIVLMTVLIIFGLLASLYIITGYV